MTFADLGLSDELLRSVETSGYTVPTPIQAQAIPAVLMMRDLIGIAQTGTGKTASFVLPMIDVLAHGRRRAMMPRSLILEPTRELAAQVAENFEKYGKNHDLKMALLIGGVQMGDQVKALNEGVDVLIATPGRLMDLFERGKILLTGCDLLVIDEADRMLDMGFIPDIETICTKLPAKRQTLLFSATMPPPIKKLADRFLTNPKYIEVSRPASSNLNIAQFKVKVSARGKREALRQLLRTDGVTTAIVFANRKTTVRELNKALQQSGFASGEIHGDIDQSTRVAELQRFKDGTVNILVASDVAARGLDVKGVSHVFNYDTPWHPDDYVHRIGRTGRAGATGRAFTFVTPEDAEAIANVEKLTGGEIPLFALEGGAAEPQEAAAPAREKSRRGEKPRKDAKPEQARQPAENEQAAKDEQPVKGDRRAPRAARPDGRADRQASRPEPRADRPAPRAERPEPRKETREASPAAREQAQPAPAPVPVSREIRTERDVIPAGVWNGPIPDFLGVSAL